MNINIIASVEPSHGQIPPGDAVVAIAQSLPTELALEGALVSLDRRHTSIMHPDDLEQGSACRRGKSAHANLAEEVYIISFVFASVLHLVDTDQLPPNSHLIGWSFCAST